MKNLKQFIFLTSLSFILHLPSFSQGNVSPIIISPPDTIISAIYQCISGPQAVPRNWDRFRNLYYPDARLIPIVQTPEGPAIAKLFSVDDFVKRATENSQKSGFWEKEISRRIEQFGNLCSVWSTYEAKLVTGSGEQILRGINSIQLMNDGTRWWIISVSWEAESGAIQLPKKYLKSVKKKTAGFSF